MGPLPVHVQHRHPVPIDRLDEPGPAEPTGPLILGIAWDSRSPLADVLRRKDGTDIASELDLRPLLGSQPTLDTTYPEYGDGTTGEKA